MEIERFEESVKTIVSIVDAARKRAFKRVNEELILMYRDIGAFISGRMKSAGYGDAFIDKLAAFFAEHYPDIKGFTRRGLYRMKQFYELYEGEEIVSTLLTQLSWSNHLKIMSACKTMEEEYIALSQSQE